jgi:hypothetical protein
MKRIMALILAATFAFAGVANAQSGVDVKVKGTWDFTFGWAETSFADSQLRNDRDEDRNADNFIAMQRVRVQVNFIASENLQGVLMFEIGDINWGRDGNKGGTKTGQGSGGDLAADGVNIETKRAYLDWMIPDTGVSVRMGIQGLALPMATNFGSPVFNDDVAAITVSYKFDSTFAITAFWARPYNQYLSDTEKRHLDDELDLFGVILPITLDGMEFTPWFVAGNNGSASGFMDKMTGRSLDPDASGSRKYGHSNFDENDSGFVWWAGLAASFDLYDPLTFSFDIMYGDAHKNYYGYFDTAAFSENDGLIGTRGWFIDARIDYAFDFGTLGLFGWWGSGDSTAGINAGQLGRMAGGFSSSGYAPTSFGWDGGFGMGFSDHVVGYAGSGTWGIGIQLYDVSFIEDLTHTLRFAYYTGTNEKDIIREYGGVPQTHMRFGDGLYLTDGDNVFEINFDHKYKIYDNLTMFIELGYIHLDRDSVWKHTSTKHNRGDDTDDAWKAQVHFQYAF